MRHHEHCPCEECERGPMLAVMVMGIVGILAMALLFRWVR